ncbi:hypothetical protein T440DRAFT_145630 [Plenodomus tracheiphilus IPT5]|uniref:Uncharacterized protein n=1 Tax=Plenodomus tracheiphilus IPT5 TaxID=1408161 RepID=A0A6A7AZM4_9PLEO|nr:hypothetical protein T440DRAFT_145630 [Plenodomus tracheiphilus IPT5]
MRPPSPQGGKALIEQHLMADIYEHTGDGENGGVPVNRSFHVHGGQTAASSSGSSGDTLNEDGISTGAPSESAETLVWSSPVSPNNLDFRRLTIHDASARPFDSHTDRYSSPYHRGYEPSTEPAAFAPQPRVRAWRENNARSGSGFNSRAGSGGFRNSRTWTSPDVQAQQDFLVVRNSMRRQFRNSEVAKWKLGDYIAHREAMVASQAEKLASKLQMRETASVVGSCVIPLETQESLRKWGFNGNFDEYGNKGRVLGEPTIWCNDWKNGKDEVAPWPSMAEMKWEGDDRAKTGVGRFLPLPREQGPPSLAWSSLPVVDQYPIDQVAKIPTMEDVYLPVDDQIEEEKEYLWSKGLEKEMDVLLES